MKKIFYQIMGLCSILGVATACNEDPEYFPLAEQPDEMRQIKVQIIPIFMNWILIGKRVSRMMNLMLLLVLGCCRGKRLKLLHKSFVPFIMRTNT